MLEARTLASANDHSLVHFPGETDGALTPDDCYVSISVKAINLRRGGMIQLAKYGPYIYGLLGQTNFDAQTTLAGVFAPATERAAFGGGASAPGSQVGAPIPHGSDQDEPRAPSSEAAPLRARNFARMDRLLLVERQLTPRLVYRGPGSLQLGFGGILQKDYLGDALGLLEDVVKSPVAQFVSATAPALGQLIDRVDISDKVRKALNLLDDREGAVRLAALQTDLSQFVPPGEQHPRSGLYALVSRRRDTRNLTYDPERNMLFEKGKAPCDDVPWLVFELRRETTRPDWGRVPDVNMAWRTLESQVRAGDVRGALNAFRTSVFLSPDLVAADSRRIYESARRKLDPLLSGAEFFHLEKLGPVAVALKSIHDELLSAEQMREEEAEDTEASAPADPALGATPGERARFQRCHKVMRFSEGGYVDHPDDRGGRTNMGVTQATYDRWRDYWGEPARHVRDITEGEVQRIYFEGYWRAGHCHKMPDDSTALILFDACVNHGPRQAMRFIQRGAGLSPSQVDGYYGPTTQAAIETADTKRLVQTALDERWRFFERLIKRDPSQEAFRAGWHARVERLRDIAHGWITGQEAAIDRLAPLDPRDIVAPLPPGQAGQAPGTGDRP